MSAPQKQTIERQAVETDTSQTQVAKQEAPRGHHSAGIIGGSECSTKNQSHGNPNFTKGAHIDDADWDIVSSAEEDGKAKNQPCGGYSGHFNIDVGWGKWKHRLYESNWNFGHHHDNPEDKR
ncbi:hypothetical protein MPDQ_005710 [Monascus purpureus]|uniref:Uncharacterized protein n=1 Tax=Monascus purpureus TaxID=5098 RepID=A0A507QFY8_MONPU|nr:hypothetical protein MPDQ_005710 [Monascus purpureus]BDD61493.1 hypothetical protein MAP00_006536 [Monascus purpureus]